MNRFRAGQGPCRANLHKRGLAQSPSCDCGHEPHCRHVPVNKTWSTKRMMTQSCGCNLQRLQHARNNIRHILCVISREKPGRPYELYCTVLHAVCLLPTSPSLAPCELRAVMRPWFDFYRAMLCIRGTSNGPVSVCLSVCLSQVGVLLKGLNVGSHK